MDPDARSTGPDAPEPAEEAERTDRLIDAALAGEPGEGADGPVEGEDRAAASTLRRVRASMVPPLPPSSRRRHLETIRTADVEGERSRPWGARLQARLAPLAASVAALLLVAGGGTVAFAQEAGPDDGLYGVKLASEQVWVSVPRGSERSAQVHIALAERRLSEARGAPHRADELIAAGLASIETAAEDDPAEAVAAFERLLGEGEGALPAAASPRARWALARNCERIASRHGLTHSCPAPGRFDEHPGRSQGARTGEGPMGWGPGGRPEGEAGPPPGVPTGEDEVGEGDVGDE